MREAKGFRRVSWPIILMGIVAAALVFSGCSQKVTTPTVSEMEDGNGAGAAIRLVDNAKTLNLSEGNVSATLLVEKKLVSQFFSEKGGELAFELAGKRVKFFVPEGAVPKPVTISVVAEIWRTPSATVYYYTCYPEGIAFLRPIMLVHPLEAVDGDFKELFWKDDAGDWVVEDFKSVRGGVASFRINHFPKYAIED